MGIYYHTPYSVIEGQIVKRRLIDSVRPVRAAHLIGFCTCARHKGFLTKSHYKSHECRSKACKYLVKFEDYPYWIDFEQRQRGQKNKMIAEMQRLRKQQDREKCFMRAARSAREFCEYMGWEIIVTRVRRHEGETAFTVYYVTDNMCDDKKYFFELVIFLQNNYRRTFKLRHVQFPNGEYVSIDEWKKIKGGS